MSATKLKTLFHDDDALTTDLQTQASNLSALVDGNKLLSNAGLTSDPFSLTNPTTPIITGNGD